MLKSKYLFLYLFLLILSVFLFFKLSTLNFQFSDGNAYFYMANRILAGQRPYQDFLLADPPLLVYLLAGVKLIIGDKIILFQTLPIFLEAATAWFLFLIIKNQTKKTWIAAWSAIFYLSSFLILSTSDFITGLHFINFFITSALLLHLKQKDFLSGLLWATAILIKLYVVPGFAAWLLFLFFKKKYPQLKKCFVGALLTGLIIMLPFLLLNFKELIDYILLHQLNRPPGIPKTRIWLLFLKKDWAWLFTAGAGLYLARHRVWLYPILAWLGFYLIFTDLYYLYLGVLAPWLALGFAEFLQWLSKKLDKNNNKTQIITSFVFLLLLMNLTHWPDYWNNFHSQHIITQEQLKELSIISQEHQLPIYGNHEIAPLVALHSNQTLFGNHIDTNGQLFGSGVLDKEKISQQAVETGILLLTNVADIPQNKKIDSGHEAYFSAEIFQQYCQRHTIIHGSDNKLTDDVAVYECKIR